MEVVVMEQLPDGIPNEIVKARDIGLVWRERSVHPAIPRNDQLLL
jgi:hypothetical protein